MRPYGRRFSAAQGLFEPIEPKLSCRSSPGQTLDLSPKPLPRRVRGEPVSGGLVFPTNPKTRKQPIEDGGGRWARHVASVCRDRASRPERLERRLDVRSRQRTQEPSSGEPHLIAVEQHDRDLGPLLRTSPPVGRRKVEPRHQDGGVGLAPTPHPRGRRRENEKDGNEGEGPAIDHDRAVMCAVAPASGRAPGMSVRSAPLASMIPGATQGPHHPLLRARKGAFFASSLHLR